MRKILVSVLVAVLTISCLSTIIIPALAQVATPTPNTSTTTTPPPLIVRWMRFHGAVTSWGSEPYQGTVIVNAKTANVPPAMFKPWATVEVVWSNEQRPIASTTKPVGEVTYTHYVARLVLLQSITGKRADPDYNLVITGIWNVNKVKITSVFDDNGALVKSTREVTPILTRAKGQMHISEDWKKFDVTIEGIPAINGKGMGMSTSTKMINPFSFSQNTKPTISDLAQLVKSYRAMPGSGNYRLELDYNLDSRIDLTDLTTIAANM
jgi:hypothetical protein